MVVGKGWIGAFSWRNFLVRCGFEGVDGIREHTERVFGANKKRGNPRGASIHNKSAAAGRPRSRLLRSPPGSKILNID